MSYLQYGQVSFYVQVMFLQNVTQIEHKIPIYNSVFLGSLWIVSLILYSVYFLQSVHTFLYNMFIYLFIYNAIEI